jgi:hypothetical protein
MGIGQQYVIVRPGPRPVLPPRAGGVPVMLRRTPIPSSEAVGIIARPAVGE